MAFASETLPPSVLILVAFPPLNIVAIAAVGVSETPTASPASLRAEALETLFPGSVPRSAMVYVWAALCDADAHSQSADNITATPDSLILDILVALPRQTSRQPWNARSAVADPIPNPPSLHEFRLPSRAPVNQMRS